MSKAAQVLRSLAIFNPYNLAARAAGIGLTGVCITYHAALPYQAAAWVVSRPGFKTGPEEARGWNKTFVVFAPSRDKAAQLEAAKAWASARYGVAEWGKVPGLREAWFPAEVVAWAKQIVKEAP